jgi:O-antigen ligase
MPSRTGKPAAEPVGPIIQATLLIVLLLAVPSKLHVGPLGSAGSPAQLLGLITCLMWFLARTYAQSTGPLPRLQPLHYAFFGFIGAVLASYVAANTRPISQVEVSAADRGLLSVIAWFGMFVLFSDGLVSRQSLEKVLWRLTYAGGAVAVLGVFQFVTKTTLVDKIVIPGLTSSADFELEGRGTGLVRVIGTSTHAIEFGVVLATILPLAIHFAIHDRHRSLAARGWPLLAILAAVPLSISRSAILLGAVVLIIVLPTLTRALQARAIATLVILGAVIYVAVPGLAGTFRSLFTGVSSDTSTESRTDSYAFAFGFVHERPLFGRGVRTFLPDYRILDNQYLNVLIEMGIVGLVATLMLFLLAIATGFAIRRTSTDEQIRSLGVSLSAAVAAGAGALTLYDGFAFPMATGAMFVSIGALSSLRRIVADEVHRVDSEATAT